MKITQIRETESAEAISVLNLESFVESKPPIKYPYKKESL